VLVEDLKGLASNNDSKNVVDEVNYDQIDEILNEFQYCYQIAHMETNCFDIHPFLHCEETNHLSEKCQKEEVKKQIVHYMVG